MAYPGLDLDLDQEAELDFQSRLDRVRLRMAELGYRLKVNSQKRTAEEQLEQFKLGRTPADGTTRLSKHQFGLAADLGFEDGTPGREGWAMLGQVAKAEGLKWGGDWKNDPEKWHVELAVDTPPPTPPVPTPAEARAGATRPLPPMTPMRSSPTTFAPSTPSAPPTPTGLAPQQPWDDLFNDPAVQAQLAGGEWEQDAAAATALGGEWEPSPQAATPAAAPLHPDLAEAEAMGAEVERDPRTFPFQQMGEMSGAFAWRLIRNLVRLPYDVAVAPMIEVGQQALENAGAAYGEVRNLLDMAKDRKQWGTPEFMAEIDRVNKAVVEVNVGKIAAKNLWLDPAKQQLAEFTRVTSKPRSASGMEEAQRVVEAAAHLGGAMVPIIGPWVGNAVSEIASPESTPTQRGEGIADLVTLKLAPKAIESYGDAYRYVKQHGVSPGPAWNRARAAVTQRLNAQIPPLERPALGVMEALPDKALNYERAVETALGEVKRVEAATGRSVTRIDDFSPALEQAMVENRKMWHDMLDAADRTGVRVDVGAFGGTIVRALRELQRLKIEMPPSMMRMLETAQRYAEQGHVSPSTAELLLQDLNAALQPVFDAMPSDRAALLKNDPSMKGLQAAAERLRTDLYDSLDVVNGTDAAIDLQKRYGHMTQVMGRVNDAWNATRSESAKAEGSEVNPLVVGGQTMTTGYAIHLLGTGHVPAGLAGLAAVGGSVAIQHLRGRAARQVRQANSVNGLLQRAVAESQPLGQVAWTRPPATTPIPRQPGQGLLPPAPQQLLPPGPGGAPIPPSGPPGPGPGQGGVPRMVVTAVQLRQLFGIPVEELLSEKFKGLVTQIGPDQFEIRPPGAGAYTPREVRTPPDVAGRTFYSGGGGVASSLDPFTIEGEVVSPEMAARNTPTGEGVVSTPPQGNYPLPVEERLPPLPGEYADPHLLEGLPHTQGERPPAVDMRGGGPGYGEEGFEPPTVPQPTPPRTPPPGRGPAGAAATPGLTTVSSQMPVGRVETVVLEQPATLKALSGKVAREALNRVRTRLDPKVYRELVTAWKDATQAKLKGSKWSQAEQTEPMVNWLRQDAAQLHPENAEFQRVVDQARRAVEDGLPEDYFPPKPPEPEAPPPVPKPPKKPRGPRGGGGAPPAGAAPGGGTAAPRKGRAAREATQAATEGIVKVEGADPTVLAHMREVTERQLGAEKWAEEQARFADEGGQVGTVAEMEHLWNALSDHLGVSKDEAAQLLMSGELGRPPERSVPATTKMAPQEPARNPLNVVAKRLRTGIESDAIYAELTEGISTTSSAFQIASLLETAKNSKYHAKARAIGERIIREEAEAREPKAGISIAGLGEGTPAPPKSKAAAARQTKPLTEQSVDQLQDRMEVIEDAIDKMPVGGDETALNAEHKAINAELLRRERAVEAASPGVPATKPAPKSKAAAAREPKPAAAPLASQAAALRHVADRLRKGDKALYQKLSRERAVKVGSEEMADMLEQDATLPEHQQSVYAQHAHAIGAADLNNQAPPKATPPKSKAAAARPQFTPPNYKTYEGPKLERRQVEVDPARLEHEGWDTKTGKQTAKAGDIVAAYSADVMDKGIRKPAQIGEDLYTNVGGGSHVAGGWNLWKLTPEAQWTGRKYTQAELHKAWDAGTIERGNDTGLVVKYKGQSYVLSDPITVRGTKAPAPPKSKAAAARQKPTPRGDLSMDEWAEVRQAFDDDTAGVSDRTRGAGGRTASGASFHDWLHSAAADAVSKEADWQAVLRRARAESPAAPKPVPPKSKAAAARQAPAAGEPAVGEKAAIKGGKVGTVIEVITAGKAGGKGINALRRRARMHFEGKDGAYEQIHDLTDLTPASKSKAVTPTPDSEGLPAGELEKYRSLQQESWAELQQLDARRATSKGKALRELVRDIKWRRQLYEGRWKEIAEGADEATAQSMRAVVEEPKPATSTESQVAKAKDKADDLEDVDGVEDAAFVAGWRGDQLTRAKDLVALRQKSHATPGDRALAAALDAAERAYRDSWDEARWDGIDEVTMRKAVEAEAGLRTAPVSTTAPMVDAIDVTPTKPVAKGRSAREAKAAGTAVAKAAIEKAKAEAEVSVAEVDALAKAAGDAAVAKRRVEWKKHSKTAVPDYEVQRARADAEQRVRQQHAGKLRLAGAEKHTVDLGGATTAKGVKEALVKTIEAAEVQAPVDAKGHISFHVPGDGTFTSPRSQNALAAMGARIEKAGVDSFEGIVSKVRRPSPYPAKMGKPSESLGKADYLDHAVTELVDAHPNGLTSADLVERLMKETERTDAVARFDEGDVIKALRRAEAAGTVEFRKGTFQPASSVRLAVLERDLLKLIPDEGLAGPELKARIEKKFGKGTMDKGEGQFTGEARQIQNALRRLLRANKVRLDKGTWKRGADAEGGTDYDFYRKPEKE